MKFFNATNNFTSGEWSPKMHARTDVQQYVNAAETIKNAIVQVQGGAFRRPGTFHISLPTTEQLALDTSNSVKMIPISYKNFSGILCAASGVTVDNWFVVNQYGSILNIDTTQCSSILLAQFFNDENLRKMHYSQIGNTLFLATGITPPIAIVFNEDGTSKMFSWVVKEAGKISYAQYLKLQTWDAVPYSGFLDTRNKGSIILNSPSGVAVGANVTISFNLLGAVLPVGSLPYPQYIKLAKFSGPGNNGTIIVELTSASIAPVAPFPSIGSGTIVYNPSSVASGSGSTVFGDPGASAWQYAEWGPLFYYNNSGHRYPRSVVGFEQRLIFSNTSNSPVTFWGSQVGNIANFMEIPNLEDASFATYDADNSRPFAFTLAAGNSKEIRALSAVKSLVLHTDDGEHVAYTANGFALGPLNVAIANSTSFGSESVQPYRVNNFLTFVQRSGRKIRDLVFSFEQDQYKSNDLTFVSDHLTIDNNDTDKIVELCKMEDPSSILFIRTENNRLLSLTLDREYSINAWAEHVIGLGTMPTSDNKVLAICVLPDHNIGDGIKRDYLYAIVQTDSTSNDKELLRLAPIYEYEDADNANPPIYLDRAKFSTFGGLGSTLIAGLSHLEGEQVDVVADGLYIGRFPIVGGQADIGRTYTWAYAGTPYETVITPLPIETGTQLGSSLGITKRVDEVTVFYWNSYGFEYGRPDENLIELDFRDPAAPTGDGIKLQTGSKRVQFPAGYDRRARVTIRQRKPWPCNILAVVTRGTTYD